MHEIFKRLDWPGQVKGLLCAPFGAIWYANALDHVMYYLMPTIR